MTGKADEYLRALARCWPPQPDVPDFWGLFRTLKYSIKHCRSRIILGMLIINGTMYCPPQLRSGLSVDEDPAEKNMQAETKRSPKTLAYDVKTSARSMSPNLPSAASAILPMLTRFNVDRNQ